MQTIFSFKRNVFSSVLDHMKTIYPGIIRAVSLYYDPAINQVRAFEFLPNSEKINEVNLDILGVSWEKERETPTPFNWLPQDFFENKNTSSSPHQREIMDELENNILLIRLQNPSDKLMDLLFLFLSKNIGLFQLEKVSASLSTREKSMIAKLSYNYLVVLQDMLKRDKMIFQNFTASLKETVERVDVIENELDKTRENYGKSIIEYCTVQLKKNSEKYDVHFSLSKKALDKLAEYKGRFDLLNEILENAAQLAINVNFAAEGSTIVIKEAYIVFPKSISEKVSDPDSNETTVPLSDRFTRTREILDRYEYAAIKLKEDGLAITGRNIGDNCHPKISHPGISDSLDKHQKKILSLFEEYPNKWTIIRNEFRSVINLINRSKWPPKNDRNEDVI